MRYTCDFNDFTPWSGAKHTWERIENELGTKGLIALESHLEEVFFDEIPSDTAINDYLWFEPDSVYKALGMIPDSATKITENEFIAKWKEDYDPCKFGDFENEGDCFQVWFSDENGEEENEFYDADEVAEIMGFDHGQFKDGEFFAWND